MGDRSQFNHQGRVPTNRTHRDILRKTDEDSWQFSQSLQILTVLAALLHDIGKSSHGFQNKLKGVHSALKGDPFRHEWVSMRIFQAIVSKAQNDEEWLGFLTDFDRFEQRYPEWPQDIFQDGLDDKERSKPGYYAWGTLPPLARAVGWLMTSHHRLPFYDEKDENDIRSVDEAFCRHLVPVNGWVQNRYDFTMTPQHIKPFWTFNSIVTNSKSWRKNIAVWADKALNDRYLAKQQNFAFFDPLMMHFARMSLMVGDHTYSSLPRHSQYGDKGFSLYANTEKSDLISPQPRMRQRLDEHLIGVARKAEQFCRILPRISDSLPTIAYHKAFKKRTAIKRFSWQNSAYELACDLREKTHVHGFFGVNMASTGCGKTLGNGRIIYGLSHPDKGARFTMALGLRVLTLQTGREYRQRMALNDSDLAILVGGQAVIDLFDLYNQEQEQNNQKEMAKTYGFGSESVEELQDGYVHFDSPIEEHYLGSVIRDGKAKKLLYAPIVTCTIDHLIGATETARGGKYIVPMLRLLSSDLILDEPDDFNLEDMPALARLVNMAGMLGSRVLLSSATLPPDMLAGLFEAYQAGRKIWNRHHGLPSPQVVCAWFDEKKPQHADCVDKAAFVEANKMFVQRRLKLLEQAPILRFADILPLSIKPKSELDYQQLAQDLLGGAKQLHFAHRQTCPETGKSVSFGLIRMSNIDPLVSVAQALYQSDGLEDYEIRLCVYHARQLFVLRSGLEYQLDRILNRKDENTVFNHSAVASVLSESKASNVIFIVLVTPVAEVGRDHDYDWAIVEPSSMRSIIQLAGRIQRHRQKAPLVPNMKIFSTNIRALKQGSDLGAGKTPVFCRPGFESKKTPLIAPEALLSSHKTADILKNALDNINSVFRIYNPGAEIPLIGLEHAVIERVMSPTKNKVNLVNAWWRGALNSDDSTNLSANPYLFHLQKQTPFRKDERQTRYVYFINDEGECEFQDIEYLGRKEDAKFNSVTLIHKEGVTPWLNQEYERALEQLGEDLKEEDLGQLSIRFGFVDLRTRQLAWNFHPLLGFWPKK